MARDIVLIPTFYRPEYLWLCLEAIHKAEGGSEKEIWIAQDRHLSDGNTYAAEAAENAEIRAHFYNRFAGFHWTERPYHSYVGNPFNFLELYKEAYHTDARYVYLVEDDVLVEQDFFKWHETVNQDGDYWCSVGWHCVRNEEVKKSEDPTAYIETSRDYSSIGVCWPRQSLEPVVKHATSAYYQNMGIYLRANFPKNPIPWGQWTEQAGLIMRLLLEGNGSRVVAWPALTRCYHIGIQGYHRRNGYKFKGTLPEKIAQLREVLAVPGKIMTLKMDNYGGDIENPRGSTPAWDRLEVVQKFKWEGKL